MQAVYRGRLAPSPTGGVHLGVARTSLVAWLAAQAAGGELVLRIEDLDTPRVVPGSAEQIIEELSWLGIDWTQGPGKPGPSGPYLQSQRSDHYARAIETLSRRGLVYPCTCSRKEIALASSAPHGEFGTLYPGTCRGGPTRPGRPASLRLRVPSPAPSFVDRLHGACAGVVADDFVLKRGGGLYAYQLAVVVDDIAMGVTEVVRGDDLLSSTPRQLALYAALGEPPPSYLHVPLVLDAQGRRLSKRYDSPTLTQLRAAGKTAEQLVGALAHSLGLTATPAPITARELVARFDLGKLPRRAAQIGLPA